MNLTKALKNWLVTNCDVKEDASDDEFKKAAAAAMIEGKLSPEKMAELTKDPKEEEANQFATKLDSVIDGLGKLTEVLAKKEETPPEKKEETPEVKTKETKETAKMVGDIGGTPTEDDPEKEFMVRVKEAAEKYSMDKKSLVYPETTRKGVRHQMAGMPVTEFGAAKMEPSQLDKAVAGAWCKFQIASDMRGKSSRFGFEALPQHDKELLCYAANEMEWDASKDGKIRSMKGYPGGHKALIDDSGGGGSGGIEAAPIVFDDMVIQTPLLFGELFPLVNVVPLDRGRRVEGVSVSQVTGEWGGIDDTAITLFDTTSYVTAFDTTIYRWQTSIQVGLDFLSDTPIDFVQLITQQCGNQLLNDLDDVIATGNGTTQPQGITNSSATAVTWSSATSIGNYESLRFSVAKEEHGANVKNSAVFCGTETSYQRAKAIPVGASDARRLFGMDYDNYGIMNRPYKINDSLTNLQVFYAVLARYRMYRRRGFVLRTSTEGDTLIRQNEILLAVYSRWGGQLERGATAGLVSDAPA